MDMSMSKLREMVKDWEAWCAAIQGVTKSQIQLSDEQQQKCDLLWKKNSATSKFLEI